MSLVEGMKDAFYRVEGLSLERVKSEIDRLLVTDHPAKGLDLLVRSGLNETSCHVKKDGRVTPAPILPELTHLVDLPQMKKFHRYDGWMHTLVVVQHTEPKLINRWAGLLHDVGKGMPGVRAVQGNKITDYGHDKKGAAMADAILARWQFPDDFRRRVAWLVKDHMKYHYFANVPEANTVKWVRHLAVSGQFSSQKDLHEAIEEMTDVTCADIIGCGFPFASTEGHRSFGEYMEKIIDQTPVTTRELHFDSSVPKALGPYVKQGMKNLLMRVQNGTLENNNSSLYQAAVNFRRRRERETSKS
jgi:tRNA nucleotidyltransferase/poly(A) polymerase